MAKKETKGKKAEEDFKYIVRLTGTDLDGEKQAWLALTKIRGIGSRIARALLYQTGIDPAQKLGTLSDKEVERLRKKLGDLKEGLVPSWMRNRRKDFATGEDYHLIGSDLFMAHREDIERMKDMRLYRGIRHERGLKVRGQRTRTTGRKGITVGVKRKGKKIMKARERERKRGR